jgi:hypothetical protein
MASITEYITGLMPVKMTISQNPKEINRSLTKIELAVDFLVVDYVEAVLDPCLHSADFKVEPLVMVIGVDVRAQNQVILILSHLIHP